MSSKRALTHTAEPSVDEKLPYFVLLGTHSDGHCLPLTRESLGKIHFFETYDAATLAANMNLLGHAFGYKIFDRRKSL